MRRTGRPKETSGRAKSARKAHLVGDEARALRRIGHAVGRRDVELPHRREIRARRRGDQGLDAQSREGAWRQRGAVHHLKVRGLRSPGERQERAVRPREHDRVEEPDVVDRAVAGERSV
jgi:hypothetical protein